MVVSVDADLSVRLERPDARDVHLHLVGRDNRFALEVDDPSVFAGGADAPAIRALAAGLARQGMVVDVVSDGRLLVRLGAVSAPWWHRRVTGSRRIRLGSVRGVLASARGRARGVGGDAVLPTTDLLPPTTMWPILPTFQRRVRRRPGTTHDPARGGGARLVLELERVGAGARQPVYWLSDGLTIGSDDSCDVVLPGLEPVHVRLEHDDRDEWIVHAVQGRPRVHGESVDSRVLRTGARVDLGPHHLAYFRDEFADHGRPHGGRIGGELGRQVPQPTREELDALAREREQAERDQPGPQPGQQSGQQS